MPRNRHSILSITPGRSRLGVAVFLNGALAYYVGKSLRQFRSETELLAAVKKIVAKLMERYEIRTVLVPDLNRQQRHSDALVLIDRLIESFSGSQGVRVKRYDPLMVRRSLCDQSKPTKSNTARSLAKRYTELTRFLFGENDWQRRYYGYVFGAIAGGEVFVTNRKAFRKRDRINRFAQPAEGNGRS